MAWELAYTSVASGPTGRSGFQFVAATPGTPPEVTRLVTPFMAYRPPPGAPSAPTPEEVTAFPTALAYGRAGGYAVVARCRYTGRDYSGRYGNFLGQAVVATPEEMEGLRPIELWGSPVWDRPAAGAADGRPGRRASPLPGADREVPAGGGARRGPAHERRPDAGRPYGVAGDAAPGGVLLSPGDAFDPESLVAWLGRERGYDRLSALLDAVTAALTGGHGRVVLVAEDAGLVARWIALVSYSLPAELAGALSFITYTADPDTAPQVLVGTVPAARPSGGFRLDEPFAGDGRPGRFARVVADCWRRGDLDGIDAVGGVLPPGPHATAAELDGAAALLALCRGDGSVSAAEQAAAAALVRARGAPAWVWPALAETLSCLTFDLAAALAGAAPGVAEHCVRLALADPSLAGRLPPLRLRDGLREEFRSAVAAASGLPALAGIVRLADLTGGAVDQGEVMASAAACARRGAGDVAAALAGVPGSWRETLAAGVLAGLEVAEPRVRRAMLTPEACAALGDRDWTRAPRTGGVVLAAGPDRREATAGLVALEPHGLPDLEDLLAALWDAPPSAGDCRWLVERLPHAVRRFAPLRAVVRRVFDTTPLAAEETVRLAELVRDVLPDLAGPARTVLACDAALRAGREDDVARALDAMPPEAPLTPRARATVARALAGRSPGSRARVLAAASAPVRDVLVRHWIAAGPDRRARVDLAEVEARLTALGITVPPLRQWGDGLGRFARRHVESALTDRDPGLAAAWRRARRRGA